MHGGSYGFDPNAWLEVRRGAALAMPSNVVQQDERVEDGVTHVEDREGELHELTGNRRPLGFEPSGGFATGARRPFVFVLGFSRFEQRAGQGGVVGRELRRPKCGDRAGLVVHEAKVAGVALRAAPGDEDVVELAADVFGELG